MKKTVLASAILTALLSATAHADFQMDGELVAGKVVDKAPAAKLAVVKPAAEVAASAPVAVEAKVVPKVEAKPVIRLEVRDVKMEDITLRNVINRWAKEAGWQVDWVASVDYPIELSAKFEGDFITCLTKLLNSYKTADTPLEADVFLSNKAIRINEVGGK